MTFVPHALNRELDLELVRAVDVSPDLVWRAWTEPELLQQWFTPKPWETVDCEIDLRPGGAFFTTMRSPDGEQFPNVGCYLEVVPKQRLVWTASLGPGYRPQVSDLPMTAVVELEPTPGGGTRYRAVAMHQAPADVARHEEMGFHDGWSASLDQLVELMSTQ